MELQDEALLYLRDNITKDEAYYILTTDNVSRFLMRNIL